MINKLSIRNYKALRSVDLELTPIHAFIGPNDSGKTSILEAIYALCRSVDYPLAEAFAGPWEGRDLVWRKEAEEIEFTMNAEDGGIPFIYHLACLFSRTERKVLVSDETLALPNSQSNKNPTRLDNSKPEKTAIYSIMNSEGVWGELLNQAPFVYHVLGNAHFYRFVPKMLALPAALNLERRYRMETSGFGLVTCLDDLLNYDSKKFEKLKVRFHEIFPMVENFHFEQTEAFDAPPDSKFEIPELHQSAGKGIFFKMKGMEETITASQVSDGMLLVLAILTLLHLPDDRGPRVLLLEEPENGIHPRLLETVVKTLRGIQPERYSTQILMTTHSPYLLDYLKREEVTLCVKGEDNATSVKPLKNIRRFESEGDIFNLGEIWSSRKDEDHFQDVEKEPQPK